MSRPFRAMVGSIHCPRATLALRPGLAYFGLSGLARAGIFRPVRPSPGWQEHWEKRKQIIGSGMIIVQRAEFFS